MIYWNPFHHSTQSLLPLTVRQVLTSFVLTEVESTVTEKRIRIR